MIVMQWKRINKKMIWIFSWRHGCDNVNTFCHGQCSFTCRGHKFHVQSHTYSKNSEKIFTKSSRNWFSSLVDSGVSPACEVFLWFFHSFSSFFTVAVPRIASCATCSERGWKKREEGFPTNLGRKKLPYFKGFLHISLNQVSPKFRYFLLSNQKCQTGFIFMEGEKKLTHRKFCVCHCAVMNVVGLSFLFLLLSQWVHNQMRYKVSSVQR